VSEPSVAAATGGAADRQDVRAGTIPSPDRREIPLVSVVMTTYKDDVEVLWRAIDSILTQTMGDLECIVVFEPVIPTPSTFPAVAPIRASV